MRVRKAAVFVVAGLIVALCTLAMPQAAHAYICWYKLYDVDGNLIYAYDNENGITTSAESLDINTLQQGVKYEFFYDGGDGDPLPSISAMAFDVKIYDGSDGASPNYGLKDTSAMSANPPITEISSKYEGTNEAVDYDESGYFIGSIKQSGTLLIKTVSLDSQVCFQIGCLPYVRGVGGSPKNLTGVATYAVSALAGDEDMRDKDDKGDEAAGQDNAETPAEHEENTQSEPKQSETYSGKRNTESPSDETDAKGKDNGSSSIEKETGPKTGAHTDSSEKDHETVAAISAESGDANGNNPGVLKEQNSAPDRSADKSTLVQEKSSDSASHSDVSQLADMGTVYFLNDTTIAEQGNKAALDKRIELTGVPYLYFALVVLLVLMVPMGCAVQATFKRKKTASRLRGV